MNLNREQREMRFFTNENGSEMAAVPSTYSLVSEVGETISNLEIRLQVSWMSPQSMAERRKLLRGVSFVLRRADGTTKQLTPSFTRYDDLLLIASGTPSIVGLTLTTTIDLFKSLVVKNGDSLLISVGDDVSHLQSLRALAVFDLQKVWTPSTPPQPSSIQDSK